MARRNPPAKWVLPEVVDPDRLCIQIEVPNDPAHIAAFRGALLALASAYNWSDDIAHTAKDVALVWRDIIDNMGGWGCSMLTDVRQSSTLPCVLEKELSGEWQPFANLRYCPPNLRISGGKIQYFDEGTQSWVDYPTDTGGSAPGSQPGSQPGGDQRIPMGECRDIVLTVQGNGITIVPFRVLPGDTVHITELSGGWTHDIGSWPAIGWYCGTGKAFVLGVCGSTDGPAGDLIATLPVGRLICQYGSNYFDAQAGVFEVNTGWSEDLLALRMNDSAYGNNAGSVTCRVEICSGEWEVVIHGGANYGTLVKTGTHQYRITSANNGSNHVIGIARSDGGDFYLSSRTLVSGSFDYQDWWYHGTPHISDALNNCVTTNFYANTANTQFVIDIEVSECP